MDENDLQIEDILAQKKPNKKKVDGKAKGNRTELNLCKLLNKHFKCNDFSKALGSGARWSQVKHLPAHARKTLVGDLCVPEKFSWVIESKGGYEDDINLTNACEGIPKLDEFIEQVVRDSDYCGRKPIIMWKRNRKPWLAIVRESGCEGFSFEKHWKSRIHYKGDWIIGQLSMLLDNTNKEFWFSK